MPEERKPATETLLLRSVGAYVFIAWSDPVVLEFLFLTISWKFCMEYVAGIQRSGHYLSLCMDLFRRCRRVGACYGVLWFMWLQDWRKNWGGGEEGPVWHCITYVRWYSGGRWEGHLYAADLKECWYARYERTWAVFHAVNWAACGAKKWVMNGHSCNPMLSADP
jgi:hypothetical protein